MIGTIKIGAAILFTGSLILGAGAHAAEGAGKSGQHNYSGNGGERPRKASLHDQFSGAGYGLAGCGLGSVIFGAKPGKIQIVASTLNGIYGNATFGMTSGTSNCDIPVMGQQAAVFIEVNKEIVKKEAARGQGDTLAGLSELLKCHDQNLFGQKVHDRYDAIFVDQQSSYGSVRELLKTIKSDSALASTCDLES